MRRLSARPRSLSFSAIGSRLAVAPRRDLRGRNAVRDQPRRDDLRSPFRQGLARRRTGLADVVHVALNLDGRRALALQEIRELLKRRFRFVFAQRRTIEIEVQAIHAHATVGREPCRPVLVADVGDGDLNPAVGFLLARARRCCDRGSCRARPP